MTNVRHVQFLRAVDINDKERALRDWDGVSLIYRITSDDLSSIPGSPFAYWLSEKVRLVFRSFDDFRSEGGQSKQGVATGEDARFVRGWWEVPTTKNSEWKNFANGGVLAPFYADPYQVLDYGRAGQCGIKRLGRYGRGASHYYRPGLTWAKRSRRFAPALMPGGCIFSARGFTAFGPDDQHLAWCGLFNSKVFDFLYKVHLGRFAFPDYEMGVLPRIPVPDKGRVAASGLGSLAMRAWALRRSLDTANQLSHAFVLPAVLQTDDRSFAGRVGSWSARVADVDAQLRRMQAEIDEVSFSLYGVSDEDLHAIDEGVGDLDVGDESGGAGEQDLDGAEDEVGIDPKTVAAELVSWTVGVVVGRFDIRLATGERDWPAEPDPFDPLPVCAPGMLTGNDGLPLDASPPRYPVHASPLLVIDPGHPLDITTRVRSVFETVFGDEADAWWADVAQALGARGRELGSWLDKGFFDHHLRTHSKARRKAPILWPIGTASGSYQVWLYAHRVTGDSLFQVRHDIVSPKIALEDQRLTQLRQAAGPSPTASHRSEIDKQAAFVDELRELAQRIDLVAPLWAPDLNDGVVVALAPLWQLFAHHRTWSRELKSHWAKLVAGEYDWAQLAMHLWPERVIPKCAEDRSLAVAHNLEEVFWAQDPDSPDKWHPRSTPTTAVDELIASHHIPAITAALSQVT